MTDFNWVLTGGKLIQTVTSLTLANNTAYNHSDECPANKRRFLLSIRAVNIDDVARVIRAIKYKEAALTNAIKAYFDESIATLSVAYWPSTKVHTVADPNLAMPPQGEIYEAGNTLRLTFDAGGVSAGGTDADGIVIEWLEVDA